MGFLGLPEKHLIKPRKYTCLGGLSCPKRTTHGEKYLLSKCHQKPQPLHTVHHHAPRGIPHGRATFYFGLELFTAKLASGAGKRKQ